MSFRVEVSLIRKYTLRSDIVIDNKIKVIQEVVSAEPPKLNESVVNKNQRDKTHFSPEKILWEKVNAFVTPT